MTEYNIYNDISKRTQGDIYIGVVGPVRTGKSTFINKVAGRKTAKTEDRPGVTRSKQWVPIDRGLELMDTPGILWPKFEDPQVGLMLAATGAVKEDVLDLEELACRLMQLLWQRSPDAIKERYGVEGPDAECAFPGYDLLLQAGKKRGFLLRGNEINTERMAKVLVDEYRSGKLGRFTLEMPEVDV